MKRRTITLDLEGNALGRTRRVEIIATDMGEPVDIQWGQLELFFTCFEFLEIQELIDQSQKTTRVLGGDTELGVVRLLTRLVLKRV